MDRTKQGEVKPNRDQEKTRSLLTLLPPEMVVMVASHLDVSSYLALASSSKALLNILLSQFNWEALLQRTRMHSGRLDKCECPRVPLEVYQPPMSEVRATERKDMEEEVKELAIFLKSVKDPGSRLFLALLDAICTRFKPNVSFYHMVSVRCPCNSVHQVTPFGFTLLDQAQTIIGGALLQKLVAHKWFEMQHLREVASRASQAWKIEQLFVHTEDDFDGVLAHYSQDYVSSPQRD